MNNLNDIKINFEERFVKVYIQINDNLIKVNRLFSKNEYTLNEIREICRTSNINANGMIYVIDDCALSGKIYRCGNYEENEWQVYATTMGYA